MIAGGFSALYIVCSLVLLGVVTARWAWRIEKNKYATLVTTMLSQKQVRQSMNPFCGLGTARTCRGKEKECAESMHYN